MQVPISILFVPTWQNQFICIQLAGPFSILFILKIDGKVTYHLCTNLTVPISWIGDKVEYHFCTTLTVPFSILFVPTWQNQFICIRLAGQFSILFILKIDGKVECHLCTNLTVLISTMSVQICRYRSVFSLYQFGRTDLFVTDWRYRLVYC